MHNSSIEMRETLKRIPKLKSKVGRFQHHPLSLFNITIVFIFEYAGFRCLDIEVIVSLIKLIIMEKNNVNHVNILMNGLELEELVVLSKRKLF